jgi:hypothetical protein
MEKLFLRKGIPEDVFVAMRGAGMRYDKEAKRGYFSGVIPEQFAQYAVGAKPGEPEPAHADPGAEWWKTWSGLVARGAELDLNEAAFEHAQSFRVAVLDAALHSGERLSADCWPAWAALVRIPYKPLLGLVNRYQAPRAHPEALVAALEGIETDAARSEIIARFYGDEMRELLNTPTVHPVAWARVIKARAAAGEQIPGYALELARDALQSPEAVQDAALPANFRRLFGQ